MNGVKNVVSRCRIVSRRCKSNGAMEALAACTVVHCLWMDFAIGAGVDLRLLYAKAEDVGDLEYLPILTIRRPSTHHYRHQLHLTANC